MCFSASVSYSAAVVLLSTGAYAVRQARQLPAAYRLWALIPVLFGVQQGFEGRVWQLLDAGNADAALPFALGFHFFSHFLWLWWLPLCSYRIETGDDGKLNWLRQQAFGGLALFGAFAGSLVYSVMLLHPEWMSMRVREHAIIYDFIAPYRSPIELPITPLQLYGLIILAPLLLSSQRLIRIFGVLVVLSMALASLINNAAFVSVWCFFAAMLSLFLVYMLRRVAAYSQTHLPDN